MDLSLLDEPAKHLRLHEDLQEATHSLGQDRLTETFTLEGAGHGGGGRRGVVILAIAEEEERIVAHYLHEETHKGL